MLPLAKNQKNAAVAVAGRLGVGRPVRERARWGPGAGSGAPRPPGDPEDPVLRVFLRRPARRLGRETDAEARQAAGPAASLAGRAFKAPCGPRRAVIFLQNGPGRLFGLAMGLAAVMEARLWFPPCLGGLFDDALHASPAAGASNQTPKLSVGGQRTVPGPFPAICEGWRARGELHAWRLILILELRKYRPAVPKGPSGSARSTRKFREARSCLRCFPRIRQIQFARGSLPTPGRNPDIPSLRPFPGGGPNPSLPQARPAPAEPPATGIPCLRADLRTGGNITGPTPGPP
jgi:hypothetical protein